MEGENKNRNFWRREERRDSEHPLSKLWFGASLVATAYILMGKNGISKWQGALKII